MDKLVMDNVSKRYGSGDTAVKALEGVSLAVREGEFVAIVGPSGSGKTTFLAAAGALLQPTSGRIALNGIEFGGKSAADPPASEGLPAIPPCSAAAAGAGFFASAASFSAASAAAGSRHSASISRLISIIRGSIFSPCLAIFFLPSG